MTISGNLTYNRYRVRRNTTEPGFSFTVRNEQVSQVLLIPGLGARGQMGQLILPANTLAAANNQPVVLSSRTQFADGARLAVNNVPTHCKTQFIPPVHSGAWTFWNQPKSAWDAANEITTLGPVVQANGNVVIYQFNGSTWSSFTLLSGGVRNDHNDGACIILPNGTLFVAYTGHNVADYFYRVSTDHTIANLGSQQTLGTLGITSPTFAYTQLAVLADEGTDGRLYIRFRHGSQARYVTSVDLDAGGALPGSPSWASAVIEVQNGSGRPYPRTWDNGADRIDFAFNDGHPNQSGTTKVYYARYDGTYKNGAGGAISLPLTPANATTVHDAGANRTWALDIAVDGSTIGILFVEYEGATTTQVLKLALSQNSGASWAIHTYGNTGQGVAPIEEPHYPGGASFVKNSPTEFFVSQSAAGTYIVRKVQFASGGFIDLGQVSPDGASIECFRPEAIADGGHFDVSWMAGRYADFANSPSVAGQIGYNTSVVVSPPNEARSLFVFRDDVTAEKLEKAITIKKRPQGILSGVLGENASMLFTDAALGADLGLVNQGGLATITMGFLVRTKGSTGANQIIASNWNPTNAGVLIRLTSGLTLNPNLQGSAGAIAGTTTATVSPNTWTLVGVQLTGAALIGRIGKTKESLASTTDTFAATNSTRALALGYSIHTTAVDLYNGDIAFGFATSDVLTDAQWDNLVDLLADLDKAILRLT